MKSSFLSRASAVMLMAAALFATASTATAAPLPLNFNTSDNRNIQIENIVSFEKDTFNVAVKVLQVQGTTQSFADSGHTTFAKMRTAALASGFYVQIPGTDRYIHTRKHTEVLCSGSNTIIGYAFMSQPLYFADGCALHAIFMANSNSH